MKPAYISTLTPLRGIAALLVVIFHFNMMVLPIIDPAITQLHRHGALMVDFFFILSGFIMTYVYGSWFTEQVSATSFWRYMSARFARLYPLHLLTLLWVIGLYILLVPINHRPQDAESQMVFDLGAIPLHLLMLHGFNQSWTCTWNLPAWSIGSEWFLYLLFPVLMPFIRRMPVAGKVALLLGIFGLYTYLCKPVSEIVLHKPWLPTMHYLIDSTVFPDSFFRCLAGFVLGMILHDVYQNHWGARVLGKGVVFATLTVILLMAWQLNVPDLWTVWVFPGLILGAVYNTGRLANILQTRPFQRLGDWSYSIYMTHVPVMFTFLVAEQLSQPAASVPSPAAPVAYGLTGPITCLVYVLIVLLVSALAYRFVEVPARNYLNVALKRRQPLPAM